MYAFPNFHRWVLLWLAVFLPSGFLTAQVVHEGNTYHATGGTNGPYDLNLSIEPAGDGANVVIKTIGPQAYTQISLYVGQVNPNTANEVYNAVSPYDANHTFVTPIPQNRTVLWTFYHPNNSPQVASVRLNFTLEIPQTVTVNPTTATTEPAGTVSLTASGSNTDYLWEIAPGSYGTLSASSGSSVVYTAASNQGVMSVRVRAIAGEGYAESAWAVAAITVGAKYSTSVSIPANNTDYARRWRIVQGSGESAVVLADWFVQPAGAPAEIRQFSDLPLGETPVYVFTGVEGVEYLDGFWKETPGAVWNDSKPSEVTPSTGATPPATPVPVSPGSSPSSSANSPGTPTAPPSSSGSVWVSSGAVSGSSVYTGPSDGTFREGITKLERELKDANTTLRDIRDAEGGIGKLEDVRDDNPSVGSMQSQGSSAGADAGSKIPTVAQPGSVTVSGAAPDFIFVMPAIMGGKSVDLNPFRSDRFGGIISWFRTATSWAVVVLFGLWASQQVKDWVKGASSINQARGNAVLGGTGAQATALVAAGIITVAVSVFLVGLVGWLGGNFALPAILGQLGVNPTSGLLGGAVWMLDQCFPVALMVSALALRVAWNFYASSIFAVAMTVIRFVVP